MGPSLSLWLFLARARLAEADAAPAKPAATRPKGKLIWIHCPGADCALKVAGLAQHLGDATPGLTLLITRPAREKPIPLPGDLAVPVVQETLATEGPSEAKALIRAWGPDMALFFSGSIPPALVAEAHKRGVPLSLFCENNPEEGLPHTAFRGRLANALIHRFGRIYLTDPGMAANFRRLGVPASRLRATGALAQNHPTPSVNEAEREALARLMGGRPAWLAMEITAAEAPIVMEAHARALRKAHRLLLFLVPDHPSRGPRLAEELRAMDWNVALRSADEDPGEDTQVYIADFDGERGLWYRLSPISFLGQSYGTGQAPDPLEPAALGSAILAGPTLGLHASSFAMLEETGAAQQVQDAASLGEAVKNLLSPERAAEMAHAAWDICSQGAEASEEVARDLLDRLPRSEVA